MTVRHILVLAVVAVIAPPPAFGQGAALPPFLELRVPKPPTIATGDDTSFLAYEMHVTNFAIQPMTLKRVDVAATDGNGVRRVLLGGTGATSSTPGRWWKRGVIP